MENIIWNKEQKFKAWLYWLKRMGFHRNMWEEDVALGPEGWRPYFDAGLRPTDALNEDLSYQ